MKSNIKSTTFLVRACPIPENNNIDIPQEAGLQNKTKVWGVQLGKALDFRLHFGPGLLQLG